MSRPAVLALALLLVLAGCNAPAGSAPTDTPTVNDSASATPSAVDERAATTDIVVVDGTLPVDANRTYARTALLLGTEFRGPYTVRIAGDETLGLSPQPISSFHDLFGVSRAPDANETFVAIGLVNDQTLVYLHHEILDDETQTETTLVHEYVHIVQSGAGGEYALLEALGPDLSNDEYSVYSSVMEGGAEYATQAYIERYNVTTESAIESNARTYEETRGARRYAAAPYHFGAQYVASRVDSPTELDDVYQNPPLTTEEVLHELPPGTEPVAPLSVSVESSESNDPTAADGWKDFGGDRMGELFVRVALREELNQSTAIRGADGWGNDTRIEFVSNGRTGYAWVLRWDDTANATEFEAVLSRYLDARAERHKNTWVDTKGEAAAHFRPVRVSDDTVVVFAGHGDFVRTADAEARGENVTVTT